MGRARGANAKLAGAFETTYGTVPGSGFLPLPFVSSTMGPEVGLIEDDLLGNGRENRDPIVVPVDLRYFGHWLKLLLGAPTTTGAGDPYTHAFASGATGLPSMSVETQLPDVPSFEMNYGLKANRLQISMQRSGLLNATIECIAKGANERASSTGAGSLATALAVSRFRQATGEISRDGTRLGSITSAQIAFTNNLDKVETIQPDGEIEDADGAKAMVSGNLTARYDSLALYTAAKNGTPVDLSFKWALGASHSLELVVPRAFLPMKKTPIEGPAGIQSSTDFMGSGEGTNCFEATLINDVASYS